MRKNQGNFQNSSRRNHYKKESIDEDNVCFNCGKGSHFVDDRPKPKKDERRPTKEYKISHDKEKKPNMIRSPS